MNDRNEIMRRLTEAMHGVRERWGDRECAAWRAAAIMAGRITPEDPAELGQLLTCVLPDLAVSVAA